MNHVPTAAACETVMPSVPSSDLANASTSAGGIQTAPSRASISEGGEVGRLHCFQGCDVFLKCSGSLPLRPARPPASSARRRRDIGRPSPIAPSADCDRPCPFSSGRNSSGGLRSSVSMCARSARPVSLSARTKRVLRRFRGDCGLCAGESSARERSRSSPPSSSRRCNPPASRATEDPGRRGTRDD